MEAPGPFERFFDFSGKRVLVTGAAHGLGAAMAAAFAHQGASLVLADRDRPGLEARARVLTVPVECHEYDQGDLQSIAALARATRSADVLINNAGLVARARLLGISLTEVRDIIGTDLVGVIGLTTQLVSGMIRRSGGSVINIGSQMAFCGAEGRGVYAAAKAAISQFTRTAALEWARYGIRVRLRVLSAREVADPDALKTFPG